MKKIAIIITILYASLLNAMELESSYITLPKELQKEIIQLAIVASDNIDQVINTLKEASALQGIQFDKLFNTLPAFNKLMNVLAKKFSDLTRQEIAEKFKTKTADEYLSLNKQFSNTPNKNFILYKEYINKGADPSFTFPLRYGTIDGILIKVCKDLAFYYGVERNKKKDQEAIQVLEYLLQNGSNPNIYVKITYDNKETLFEFLKAFKNSAGYNKNSRNISKIWIRHGIIVSNNSF